MRPLYATATFTGDERKSDLRNGDVYVIEIRQSFFGRIVTWAVHGYEYKRYNGIKPYISRDLFGFVHDWQIKQFEKGPQPWQIQE